MDIDVGAPRVAARGGVELRLDTLAAELRAVQPETRALAYAAGVTRFRAGDVAREEWPRIHAMLSDLRREYGL